MSPDRLDKQSRHPKRRHSSHSVNMTASHGGEVIDLTSEPETSSSRKHGRHEKDHQDEGSSKRQKLKRGSEPPMRKDKIITPTSKRKKPRNEINNHKASRTNKHKDLKDRVSSLERDLKAHEDTNREQLAELVWHAEELERLGQRNNEQAEEVQEQIQRLETARQEIEVLRSKLEDSAHGVEALQRSCQNKDEYLTAKDEVITAMKRVLDNTKLQSASLENSLVEMESILKGKDQLIAAKQNELDDSRHRCASLNESLHKAELTAKGKDAVMTGLEEQLQDSHRQSVFLEKSLAEMDLALKSKHELIAAKQEERDIWERKSANSLAELQLALEDKSNNVADMQQQLDDSKQETASLKEAFAELRHELKTARRVQSEWRDKLASSEEKLDSTKRELDVAKSALEEAEKMADALHLVNDKNGAWNHKITQRENTAKEKLQSARSENKKQVLKLGQEKTELQNQCGGLRADLEAQENERNQAVSSLQLKLKASRPQSQRYGLKEPDEKIKNDFANLESTIRQFVDSFARPVLKITDQELKTIWPNWSLELRRFLASPLLCNLVLEAHIWERLLARVFSPGSKVWGNDLGRSLEQTLDMAAEDTAEAGYKSELFIDYQYLRSSSNSLVDRLHGGSFLPKYFDADVKSMVSTMAKLCGVQIDESMNDDAMDIFKLARDFAIQLRMLRAEYTFRMHHPVSVKDSLKHGFAYAGETMANRSPAPEKNLAEAPAVDFIMSPGLYKRGDNSGADYEAKTCTVKMGVVCNAARFCLNQGGLPLARPSTPESQKGLRPREVKQTSGRSASRSDTGSAESQAKKGSSVSNPFLIKTEETDAQQDLDPLATPGLTFGSPVPKERGAAKMQSGMVTDRMTRSHGSPKAGSNVHDGKVSTKTRTNHSHYTGTARGRGGGSLARRGRHGKGSEPDASWSPGSNI